MHRIYSRVKDFLREYGLEVLKVLAYDIIAGLSVVVLFTAIGDFMGSHRQNTNIRHTRVTRIHHITRRKVHGNVFTKHFYKGTASSENDLSPKTAELAKEQAVKGARDYINGTANRSQYLTYIAPAKVEVLNANTGYGDTIRVAETTAVFVKKADYTNASVF